MTPKKKHVAGTPVSRDQVAAFRLHRHHLTERAPRKGLVPVVAGMGGAQAQLVTAAQISAWARVRDLEVEDIESALWKDRRLVKAWCMRRTVHLLPSRDLAMFVRGSARRAEKEIRYVLNRGVGRETLEELLTVVLTALDRPISRPELAARVSTSLNLSRGTGQYGGWGSRREVACVLVGGLTLPADFLLHLAGARGVVCAGPSEVGQSTYVRADAWVPGWHDMPPERAEEALLRLYLRAFGPATPSDFTAWTQMLLTDARGIWARMASELTLVEVEGKSAWILRSDRTELERAELAGPTVRLLPYFDSFLMGHEVRDHLVESHYRGRLSRPAGWIAPAVLVNGRVAGVWNHVQKGKRLNVRVAPFAVLPVEIRAQIRLEARDLGRFLGSPEVTVSMGS